MLAGSLLFLNLRALPAECQTTGQITGIVRDQTGAVIVGAEITVASRGTGDQRIVVTDATGSYVAPLLLPGTYQVSIAAPGFRTMQFMEARVDVTETTTLNTVLTPASVVESVSVNAASLVQTAGAQLGRVVDSSALAGLPLATRNVTQILGLSPGATTYLPDNTAIGRNTQTVSVNGARVTENNVQIDGIDVNTMGTSAAVNIPTPAPEAIQEFKVQTALYDATFGRAGGGNIQLVTKNGTNAFQGVIYEYLRRDALNANNPFLNAAGVQRPALKRDVFGGTVGGPIRKDRSFFFFSYQGTRETNGASGLNSLSSNVLIAPPGLTDDRSEKMLLKTFGPTLPDGRPASSIDPAALALLNAKLPSGQFVIPTPQANGRYSGSAPSRFQEDQFTATVDHRLGSTNSLVVKAFFANAPSMLVLPSFRGAGANVPGFGFDQRNDNRVIVAQDVHAFSATVFNEARIGYTAHHNYFSPEEPVRDSDVGIRRANADLLPGLPLIRIAAAAGGLVIGTPTNITPAFPSVTTLADTLSITRGRHAIRLGAEIRHNAVNLSGNNFTRGQIDFADFNSFLTGTTITSVFGGGIGDRNLRATDYNVFAQDDWKTTPRLTVNLGVRYELDLPPYDTLGRLSTFDPSLYQPRPADKFGNPVGPPLGGFVQAGNVIPQYDLLSLPKGSKGVVKSVDGANVAPRLGLAYSPLDSGRLSVRTGYGLFYSRATFQYVSTSVTVPPTYVLGRQNGRPLADPFFSVPPSDQFPTFVPTVTLAGSVLDRNIRTPYFHQYSGSVQYEWAKDLLVEVAYVGTQGRHLFRQVAINQARLASAQNPITNDVTGQVITANTVANANLRAPFQGVSISGFSQNQSTAQSSYNSLQLSLTQRVSHGLQFLGSYTYAKSIDNGSGQGGGAGINGVVNPGGVGDTGGILGNQLDDRANRGVSDFDRTHRFVLSYVWDLPQPRWADRSTALRLLLGGWQIAGIATAMSGLPIDIVDTGAGSFYGLANGSVPLARPSFAPGEDCSAAMRGVPTGYFFNPLVFARPTVRPGQPIPSSGGTAIAGDLGTDLGDVGRNCLRGPRQTNVDLAIAKRFRFRGARYLELRAEFFNVFNHVNFANPISDLDSFRSSGGSMDPNTGQIVKPGDFGRIISTSNNPRLIQFALKFSL